MGSPRNADDVPSCTVPDGAFYAEYHGHKVKHLEAVRQRLAEAGARRFIYLAGDSSLDNKHWFFDARKSKASQLERPGSFVDEALNGYEHALSGCPPRMVKDVCYWLNQECQRRHTDGAPHVAAINTAVEESCLSQREVEGLLPQDQFIRDHITGEDVLVVDVGGNDVALRPTPGVIFNMGLLLLATPTVAIRASLAPGLLYFIYMFRVRLRRYIESLIAIRKPKRVVVCMLYFLDEAPTASWANGTLKMLGYDSNPAKLQAVIQKVYEWGVSQIQIPGVEVVSLPLYEALDGKDSSDYVQRVEPSVTGGRKMASAIIKSALD